MRQKKKEDILEVSTASPIKVGKRLSAFNLKYPLDGKKLSLESVYQGCKVFREKDTGKIIGPFHDIFYMNPFEAKKFIKRYNNDKVVEFILNGKTYSTEPKSSFYDFLYINCLVEHEEWIMKNIHANAFSDIFYSKNKGGACQARTMAIFKTLSKNKILKKCASDFNFFLEILEKYN